MKTCFICQKGSVMGGTRKLLRGHYNLTNRKRKYPNLQWATLLSGKRVKVCMKCLKKINTK